QVLEVLPAAPARPPEARAGQAAQPGQPAVAALVRQAVELRDPLLQPRHRCPSIGVRRLVLVGPALPDAGSATSGRAGPTAAGRCSYRLPNKLHPLARFESVAPLTGGLPQSVWASPAMLCWARLFGLCLTKGCPATRAAITALVSLGTCQKIGLPITSSAFFRLIPSSTDSDPTRLTTTRIFSPSMSSVWLMQCISRTTFRRLDSSNWATRRMASAIRRAIRSVGRSALLRSRTRCV